MHVLYFDAVKRETARQTEGERHTDRDFITFYIFYIDGRERERERETERERERERERGRDMFYTCMHFILMP